ncbi:MAG: glycosyltransferase family 4 protein, partial [Desulfobacterales bacterium]|nr:glycosyltransferase family 4 protein [Desulfobacterales bacterium]
MRKPKCPDSIKIAMLGSLPPLRGLSSYCLELALSIANVVEVEFISFKKLYPSFIYPGGGLGDDNTFPVIRHSGLEVKRRLTWYNPLTWLREGLYSRAELLHAQWWSLPLFPVYAVVCCCFKIRHRPVVMTVHNVLSHENSVAYKMLSKLLFALCDHFIVHTEINKQQMISEYGIRPERLSLIPHGTLDFHVKQEVERADIRKEMGFDPDNKIILIFGAVRSYKGIDTAIKAFAEVLAKVPESRLLIAGKLWGKWE